MNGNCYGIFKVKVEDISYIIPLYAEFEDVQEFLSATEEEHFITFGYTKEDMEARGEVSVELLMVGVL